MPKHIVTDDVRSVVLSMIDSWQGKLSWKLLCERVSRECALDATISRHTLLTYPDIELAFKIKKDWLRNNPETSSVPNDLQLRDAYKQIEKLKAEVLRLKSENTALTEQFIRWQYNLYLMGHRMNELNGGLPNGTDMEALKERLDIHPLPSNVDAQALNRPMTPLSRATDKKRYRVPDKGA